MPVSLVASRPAPLPAPLSRSESAELIPSGCQACGASCGADWANIDGVGVLVHRSGGDCPVALPFVWATGEPVRALRRRAGVAA